MLHFLTRPLALLQTGLGEELVLLCKKPTFFHGKVPCGSHSEPSQHSTAPSFLAHSLLEREKEAAFPPRSAGDDFSAFFTWSKPKAQPHACCASAPQGQELQGVKLRGASQGIGDYLCYYRTEYLLNNHNWFLFKALCTSNGKPHSCMQQ